MLAFTVNKRFHTAHLPSDPEVRDAVDSVVQIRANDFLEGKQHTADTDRMQIGSGWVAGSGLIATADHVVAGAREVQVASWDGKTSMDATIVYENAETDIALLAVDNLSAKPLKLGSRTPVESEATRLGFPNTNHSYFDARMLRIGDDWKPQMVAGSTVPRSLAHGDGSQGTSGGPIVDGMGQVLGMVEAFDKAANTTVAITRNDIATALREYSSGNASAKS